MTAVLWLWLLATLPSSSSCAQGDWARVTLEPDVLETRGGRQLEALLTRHLAGQGVHACAAGTPGEAPLAIRIAAPHPDRVSVEVQRADGVALERFVMLGRVKQNGRALTLAITVDELVRAARALPVASPPEPEPVPEPPSPPPPPPPAPTPVKRPPAARASRWGVGLAGAGEQSRGGLLLLGGDLTLQWRGAGRWALEGALGIRRSPEAASLHGSVHAVSARAAAGPAFALWRRDRWRLEARAALASHHLWWRPTATPAGTARADQALALTVDAGPRLTCSLPASLLLGAALSAGYVLRGAEAQDDGARVTALRGALVAAGLSLARSF